MQGSDEPSSNVGVTLEEAPLLCGSAEVVQEKRRERKNVRLAVPNGTHRGGPSCTCTSGLLREKDKGEGMSYTGTTKRAGFTVGPWSRTRGQEKKKEGNANGHLIERA